MTVFTNVTKDQIAKLLTKGYKMQTPKSQYETFRLSKSGVTLIHYTSKKLLLQGKKQQVDKIAIELEKQNIGKLKKEKQKTTQSKKSIKGIIIGSDETLKGDTFGGIIIAAVKADDKIRQKLIEIGVTDSKQITDKTIPQLAKQIKQICECEIINLFPNQYNQETGNVTTILNRYHKQAAKDLRKPNQKATHIVDKYPGCRVGDIAETKAESKYVEVAAASIIARQAALEQIKTLSKQIGFKIPLGSTHVKGALNKLKKSQFKDYVKMNFKNVLEVYNKL
jgi:ribonuclease HIII